MNNITTPPPILPQNAMMIAPSTPAQADKRSTSFDRIMAILSSVSLLYDKKNCYVDIGPGNNKRLLPAPSGELRKWLMYAHYNVYGVHPKKVDLDNAMLPIEFFIRNNGQEIELHNRYMLKDGMFLVDVGDINCTTVNIGMGQYTVTPNSKQVFFRNPNIDEMKLSTEMANPRDLFAGLNIRRAKDQIIVLAWLITQFVPNIQRPLLLLIGESGSGKSTAARYFRTILDPCTVLETCLSKSEDTFAFGMHQNAVPFLDNVSKFSQDISDRLCRTITLDVYSKRAHYEDSTMLHYVYERSPIVTAIKMPITAPDLLKRTIAIEMFEVPDDSNRDLDELSAYFEEYAPKIRTMMFHVLSKARAIYPYIKLNKRTRFSEFDRWATAITIVLTKDKDSFMQERFANLFKVEHWGAKAEPLVLALKDLLKIHGTWSGTISKLMLDMSELQEIEFEDLPPTEVSLGIHIASLMKESKNTGILIKKNRSNLEQIVTITLADKFEYVSESIPTKAEICSTCLLFENVDPPNYTCAGSHLHKPEINDWAPSCIFHIEKDFVVEQTSEDEVESDEYVEDDEDSVLVSIVDDIDIDF